MSPSNEVALREDVTGVALVPARREHTDGWIAVVDQVAELAAQVASTNFVPKGLRNDPAGITAAILFGRELDMPPMHALSGIHMVEGKPTLAAETMRAMVLAAGHEIGYGEISSGKVEVKGRRKGESVWTVIPWTIADAQRAGVARKQVWVNYPRQMLAARATSELCRLIFPDVTHGMRATEEVDDGYLFELEGGPTGPAGGTPDQGSTKVTRKAGSTRARTGPTDANVPAAPAPSGPPVSENIAPPPPPPAPAAPSKSEPKPDKVVEAAPEAPAEDVDEQGQEYIPDAVEVVDDAVKAAAPVDLPDHGWSNSDQSGPVESRPRPMHSAQTKALQARFKGLGFTDEPDDREIRLLVAAAIVGREIDSFRAGDGPEHMTYEEAEQVMSAIKSCLNRGDVIALMAKIAQDNQAEEGASDA